MPSPRLQADVLKDKQDLDEDVGETLEDQDTLELVSQTTQGTSQLSMPKEKNCKNQTSRQCPVSLHPGDSIRRPNAKMDPERFLFSVGMPRYQGSSDTSHFSGKWN